MRRACSANGMSFRSASPRRTAPLTVPCGVRQVLSWRRRVDFPLPLSPQRTVTAPSGIVSVRSLSAGRVWPG